MNWIFKHKLEVLSYICSIIILFFIFNKIIEYKHNIKTHNKGIVTTDTPSNNYDDLVLGNYNAPISIYIFYSYTCTPCLDFFSKTYPKLEKQFLRKGKIKLILKPVNFTENQDLTTALECLYCLNQLGQLENMHHLLIDNSDIIFSPEFKLFTKELIDHNTELQLCLGNHRSLSHIQQNTKELLNLSITATPTFIIGNSVFKGELNYSLMKKILKKEIERHDNQQ